MNLASAKTHLRLLKKSRLDQRRLFAPERRINNGQQVEALRQRQAALLADEGDNAGKEVHQEAGTDRLSDLINKDPMYHIVLTTPRLLAGIAHVLEGDLKLSSLNSRSALPGQGLQALHADWGRLDDTRARTRSATASGCWMISRPTMARLAWFPVRTAPGKVPVRRDEGPARPAS